MGREFSGHCTLVAAGCNAVTDSFDISGDCLAFCTGSQIGISRLSDPERHIEMLSTALSSGQISTIKLLDYADGLLLACGTTNGLLCIWKKLHTWELCFEHQVGRKICALAFQSIQHKGFALAASTDDSDVHIWRFEEINSQDRPTFEWKHVFLEMKPKKCTAIALGSLTRTGSTHSRLILLCAKSDSNIYIYCEEALEDLKFRYCTQLSGHLNWVTCLCIAENIIDTQGNRTILFGSSSLDKTARLWKIVGKENSSSSVLEEIISTKDAFVISNGKEETHFVIENEALLCGHGKGVNSITFSLSANEKGKDVEIENVKVITCSSDHSVMAWTLSSSSGSWISKFRVADTDSAGGLGGLTNSYGILRADKTVFGEPDEKISIVVALGSTGSISFWKEQSPGTWSALPPLTGHFGSVNSCSWDTYGRFLATASSDQTTRIFAPWRRQNLISWHEISRPQVHGYAIHSLAFIPPPPEKPDDVCLVSGADEKVARIFVMPRNFFRRQRVLHEGILGGGNTEQQVDEIMVPALGLSNKAIGGATLDLRTTELQHGDAVVDRVSQPPDEAELSTHTLWPEAEKLYGHGSDIFCLCVSPDGQLIASSAKANFLADAGIRFWSRKNGWKAASNDACVSAHSLTVTHMSFSPDNMYLLSVSRDRSWSIIECRNLSFHLVQKQEDAHGRIIWCCQWAPDGAFFVTGSRDKKLKTWKRSVAASDEWIVASDIVEAEFSCGVNSVDIHRRSGNTNTIMAAGLENGTIIVHTLTERDGGFYWSELQIISSNGYGPSLAVNSLKWRPPTDDERYDGTYMLAAASTDKSLRIYSWDRL